MQEETPRVSLSAVRSVRKERRVVTRAFHVNTIVIRRKAAHVTGNKYLELL